METIHLQACRIPYPSNVDMKNGYLFKGMNEIQLPFTSLLEEFCMKYYYLSMKVRSDFILEIPSDLSYLCETLIN